MVKKFVVFCSFLALSVAWVSGQNSFLDSLKFRIKAEKNDTTKVSLMVQLGNHLRNSDVKESWRWQKQIDSIAKKTGNEYLLGQSCFLAATIQLEKETDKAAINFEKAIKIFTKYLPNSKSAISLGSAYINLGLLHYQKNDYEGAVAYYLKAESIYRKYAPRNSDLSVIYSNLSIAYGTINKYDEALHYSKKGLAWARGEKDRVKLMNALYAHGGNLVNAKKGSEGLALLDSAKQIAIELNDLNYWYSSDFIIAMYYYNTGQYKKSIEYYTQCLNFARKYNFAEGIGNNFLNIATNEAKLKLYRQAAAHLDSSAKYLNYTINSVSKQTYFENYAEVYKQLGNFTRAFAFKDSAAAIKEKLYQADNIKQLEFRQARYNYDLKQKEILQLETEKELQKLALHHKNLTIWLFAGGLCALLTIIILLYRNFRFKQNLQKKRIEELETEKQLAATEAVLKGEEQERTRLAKDLHDGLGGMLSGIKYSFSTMKGNLIMTPENLQAFERGMDMLDSSIKEMRRVAHNMMPEALVRFGLDTALKDFCNDITQSGALTVNYQSLGMENLSMDQTMSITLYRIVQELLNNIIKHASATSAIVQLTKSGQQLTLTVEDDGKGFDTSILKTPKGIGWVNIRNRVEFLKGKPDITSCPGEGTSVQIEIPIV